jgi:hypothetical protein
LNIGGQIEGSSGRDYLPQTLVH